MNNPSWQDFVTSTNVVRDLEPGQRPKDWMDSDPAALLASETPTAKGPGELGRAQPPPAYTPDEEPERSLMSLRFRVQFTASQEYVDLLQRAQDLLSHAVANRSIEEVHLRAMREFVSVLEKCHYASEERLPSMARESSELGDPEPKLAEAELPEPEADAEPTARVPGGGEGEDGTPRSHEFSAAPLSGNPPGNPRQRGRYTPAEVRRSVRERDGARCAYVDEHGRRCGETSFLELHHRDPFARGGPATRSNLTIYCRSHNALAAEQDFGRAHMTRKTGADG